MKQVLKEIQGRKRNWSLLQLLTDTLKFLFHNERLGVAFFKEGQRWFSKEIPEIEEPSDGHNHSLVPGTFPLIPFCEYMSLFGAWLPSLSVEAYERVKSQRFWITSL